MEKIFQDNEQMLQPAQGHAVSIKSISYIIAKYRFKRVAQQMKKWYYLPPPHPDPRPTKKLLTGWCLTEVVFADICAINYEEFENGR